VAPVITATLPSSFPILLSFPDTLRQQSSRPNLGHWNRYCLAAQGQRKLGLARTSAYFRTSGHILGPLVGLN
jgi:hypothetical protein